MDKYLKNNKELWNELTPIHAQSEFYDVEGFKAGKCALKSIELEEVGDITDKSLLHLQCHFGMDTLSWARRGAKATGVDFSDEAIKTAIQLSEKTGIKAKFICSDIYDLPKNLSGKFDIVFTSEGVLAWLPDLKKWAEIIAHFLKRGGFFYIREFHPFKTVFDDSPDVTGLKAQYSYFHTPEPTNWEPHCDYTLSVKGSLKWINDDPDAVVTQGSYEWTHSLGDIITSLTNAGLRIEFLHEFPTCGYKALPFMKQGKDGWWRIEGDPIPLMFSLKATKA